MLIWIRKSARLAGMLVFFIVLFLGVDYADPFNAVRGTLALIKAFCAGAAVWLVFFIIGDIIFKGLIEDIEPRQTDVLDEGLLQHIHQERDRAKAGPENTANG
jgi:hypothetical protein